ncbi:hypothetical protein [Sphaerimonospora thailandensis]|uniref:Serine peptidase n=1 Tax=Sphaerimonospora thailandensis TaxID=795644 RepID=A0A8J3R5K4_9ACTN|nr:hypothetical protein [Sphaerimonospora thailandensis]GIH68399.1 hypothetical protein Mth01_06520 [Sphaerimonospora thailandensis]
MIVGVHGIGKYRYYEEAGGSPGRAAETMRLKWNGYLGKGLGRGIGRGNGEYFSEIAYYAHHLRPAAQTPGPARSVSQPELKQMEAPARLVFADWAAQLDGRLRGAAAAGESLTGVVHRLTGWLLDSLGPRAVRFAESFCPEVAAYLGGGDPRSRARDAVADTIRRRAPRVVVAHSLGSVVTYEALWAQPELEVELLVTLGSPLGMRNVVFERLLPAPLNGWGTRPPGVRRWINVADKDDIAAIPSDLGGCFEGVERDLPCNIDALDFHTVRNYLGCGVVNDYLKPYVP